MLLSDELAQRGGPHARGEWLAGEVRAVGAGARVLRLKELLFHETDSRSGTGGLGPVFDYAPRRHRRSVSRVQLVRRGREA